MNKKIRYFLLIIPITILTIVIFSYCKSLNKTTLIPIEEIEDSMLAFNYVGGGNAPSIFPGKDDGYYIIGMECEGATGTWNNDKWSLALSNITGQEIKCTAIVADFNIGQSWVFDYTGEEQEFNIPSDGKYKIELWGAQGGSYGSYTGGYGGYSTGKIYLEKGTKLFINVGGAGDNKVGGYNGGGNTNSYYDGQGGGGGATHIATTSGLIASLNPATDLDKIIIVAGGGGGCDSSYNSNGGNAGGYIGNSSTGSYGTSYGGTQTSGGTYERISTYPTTLSEGSFGQGGAIINGGSRGGSGGGGLYGGSGGHGGGGGGGSSYVGNPQLMDGEMYCTNCAVISESGIITKLATGVTSNPEEYKSKIGSGYAKITYIGFKN